jgi:hypothetical protein
MIAGNEDCCTAPQKERWKEMNRRQRTEYALRGWKSDEVIQSIHEAPENDQYSNK